MLTPLLRQTRTSWQIHQPSLRQASVAALAAAAALPGYAADEPASSDDDGGSWQVAPYLYGVSIKGKVGLARISVAIDVEPEDIAGDIKAGAMGYVRWVSRKQFVYAEGLGVSYADDAFDQFFNQPVKATVALTEVGYGRNFYAETVAPAAGMMTISPYVGVRYAQLKIKVPNPYRQLAENDSWLDPVLGVIIEAPLLGPVNYAIKADGAGLGLGRDQYLSLTTALRYTHNEDWSVVAGYRIASFDAEPGGGNNIKLQLHAAGPEVGLVYTF